MDKNVVVPLVIAGFIGVAVYLNKNKTNTPQIDDSFKRNWIKNKIAQGGDSEDSKIRFNNLIDTMSSNEVEIIYIGLSQYNHPTEASNEFQRKFFLVAKKYGIFT